MLFIKRNKNFIAVISFTIISCLLYSNILWAAPDLDKYNAYTKETLAPESDFIKGIISKLDSDAAGLLMGILGASVKQRDLVSLDKLWEWIEESKGRENYIPIYKKDKKIVILAKGLNIEFAATSSKDSFQLPNSNLWVNLNYYPSLTDIIKYAGSISGLSEEQRSYIAKNSARLANSLREISRQNNHEEIKEIKFENLDAVVSLGDEQKDEFIDSIAQYLNRGPGRALALLGNYFDIKGIYLALARKGIDPAKLQNVYALYKYTNAGDGKDPKKYLPSRNLLCFPPIAKGGQPFMPLYQFVYRRTVEHQYKEGADIKKTPIVIEEFSPFYEKDARTIEDLEIKAWTANDIVVKRENIRERHRRNPVYIIREGNRIVGGIATSYLKIEGRYDENIPKKYKQLIAEHNPAGDTIFDFSVFTDQSEDMKPKKYGDVLALATLDIAKQQGKMEVIAASRCEAFAGFLNKHFGLSFKNAMKEIKAFLAGDRSEISVLLPKILEHYLEGKGGSFDLSNFIWEHLNGKKDSFLEAFHHRMGSRDVLIRLNSRSRDTRGFGAQVYTTYLDVLNSLKAGSNDRQGLYEEIFGKYYKENLVPKQKQKTAPPKESAVKGASYAWAFSVFKRKKNLEIFKEQTEPLDVLIIGGGITGASAARDASLRGLKTGLICGSDFNMEETADTRAIISRKERRALARIAPYSDNEDKLCLANLISANRLGAFIANYLDVIGVTYDKKTGIANGVIAEDKLTGEKYTIRAGKIIDTDAMPLSERIKGPKIHGAGIIYAKRGEFLSARQTAKNAVDKSYPKTKCQTHIAPVLGGDIKSFEIYLDMALKFMDKEYGISPDDKDIALYLISKYGTHYSNVLFFIKDNSSLRERIFFGKPYLKAEIVYQVHYGMVVHLRDFLMHRTDIDSVCAEMLTHEKIFEIAKILGKELDWTNEQIGMEVLDYLRCSRDVHNKKDNQPNPIQPDVSPAHTPADTLEVISPQIIAEKVLTDLMLSHGRIEGEKPGKINRRWKKRISDCLDLALGFNRKLEMMQTGDSTFVVPSITELDNVKIIIQLKEKSPVFWLDREKRIVHIDQRLGNRPVIVLNFLFRSALDILAGSELADEDDLRRNDLEFFFSLTERDQLILIDEFIRLDIVLPNGITGERLLDEKEHIRKNHKYRWQDKRRLDIKNALDSLLNISLSMGNPDRALSEKITLLPDFIYRLTNLRDRALSIENGEEIRKKLEDLITELKLLPPSLQDSVDKDQLQKELASLTARTVEVISIANHLNLNGEEQKDFRWVFFNSLITENPQIDFIVIYTKGKLQWGKLRDFFTELFGEQHYIKYSRQGGYRTIFLAAPRIDYRKDADLKWLEKEIRKRFASRVELIKIQVFTDKKEMRRPANQREHGIKLVEIDTGELPMPSLVGDDAIDEVVKYVSMYEQRLSNRDKIRKQLTALLKREPLKLFVGVITLFVVLTVWQYFDISAYSSPAAYLELAMLTGLSYMGIIFILTLIYEAVLLFVNRVVSQPIKSLNSNKIVWGIGLFISIIISLPFMFLGPIYLKIIKAPYLHEAFHIFPDTIINGSNFGGIVVNKAMGAFSVLLTKISPFITQSDQEFDAFAMQVVQSNANQGSFSYPFQFLAQVILPPIMDLVIAAFFIKRGNDKKNPVLIGFGAVLVFALLKYFLVRNPLGDFMLGGKIMYLLINLDKVTENVGDSFYPAMSDFISLSVIVPFAFLIYMAFSASLKWLNYFKGKMDGKTLLALAAVLTIGYFWNMQTVTYFVLGFITLFSAIELVTSAIYYFPTRKGVKEKVNIPKENAPDIKVVSEIVSKILGRDENLDFFNNIGIVNELTDGGLPSCVITRFNSLDDVREYLDKIDKEKLIKLLTDYYVLYAYMAVLEGRDPVDIPTSSAKIKDEDIIAALLSMIKNKFIGGLTNTEENTLKYYIKNSWNNRKKIVAKYQLRIGRSTTLDIKVLERIRKNQKRDIEDKVNAFISDTAGRKPGMLYFDIDKILCEDSTAVNRYIDLLSDLSKQDDYAVVLVNSDPNRSINERLGELSRKLGRVIKLDAVGINESNRGRELIRMAIELAKGKLKTEIPRENIVLAIYAPNRWLYPYEFLSDFIVITLSPEPINIDETEITKLEGLLPGIRRFIEENRVLLLKREIEEIKELDDELGKLIEARKEMGKGA